MTREQAVQSLRRLLDEQGLPDWRIRVTTDISKPFLGLTDYNVKTIFLNGFSIDTHPDAELQNTIRHEVAHALVGPGHGHDDVWRDQAKLLGCDNTRECGMALSMAAIDAIRSGASLEVIVDEEVIRTPRYKITRLQEKCKVCGKVAKEVSSQEIGEMKLITLECGHVEFKELPKKTPYHEFTSIVENACARNHHFWDTTSGIPTCTVCGAHKPYDFQVQGMQFLEKALVVGKGGAIFDEMGLGKTIQALGVLRYHPEYFPVLFIVPSSIMYQWAKQITTWLGDQYFPQIIFQGKSYVFPKFKCYVTSYDLLRKLDLSQFKHIKCVVLDEVQKIKNVDATRTQQVRQLVRDVPNVIELSGTPWKNRGSEFFPALNILNPIKFNSFEGFKNRWVDYYWDGNKQKEGGINNVPAFKEFTSDILIRRERSEVMKELPSISRNRFYTQIDSASRKVYDATVSDFVASYNQAIIDGTEDSFATAQNVVAQLQRMRHVLGIAKIGATVDMALQFADQVGKKLVIFVHHKDVGEIIVKELTEKVNNGYVVKKLTADMPPDVRFTLCEEFNATEKIIMVASTLASGEGLNLQTCADCIMHERQWNPQNEEQAEGRFIRIGQTAEHVTATYMHADSSVDTHLDAIVERKRIMFHNAMNRGEMPQWNEANIIKELAQSIVDDFNRNK